MANDPNRSKLDPHEELFFIESGRPGLRLSLRRLAAPIAGHGSVLYLHGATFPAALSVAYRFEGRSWRDALCEAGFDAWSVDFLAVT